MRRQASVMDLKENDEFISDMVLETNKRLLLASRYTLYLFSHFTCVPGKFSLF